MEIAGRLKKVDKLVMGEAVKITVGILRKMEQNKLAEQLDKKHMHAQAEGNMKTSYSAEAHSKEIQADKSPVQIRSSAQPGAYVLEMKTETSASVNAPVLTGSTFTGTVNFNFNSHAAGNDEHKCSETAENNREKQGNRDCKANVNVDLGDLIIKGLQVEESRKAKKQAKVEQHCRATKKSGIPAGHAFQAESSDKVDAQAGDFE